MHNDAVLLYNRSELLFDTLQHPWHVVDQQGSQDVGKVDLEAADDEPDQIHVHLGQTGPRHVKYHQHLLVGIKTTLSERVSETFVYV